MTFFVDPFEHYRESSILPLYDQESYNNPGIARNYDYNAAILGTSMVEMSMPSVVDQLFSVSTVKLPMRGSHTAQMGWQLSHIFKKQDLKMAVLAIDAYSLQGPVDDMEEIYDYLWNDDLMDDVYYLLNRDVLLVKVPAMLKNRGKSLSSKRDEMYMWTDVVFSEQSVLNSVKFSAQQTPMDPLYREERTIENITRHLESAVRDHPETTFYLYFPPYSVAYWYQVVRGGLYTQQFHSRELVAEKLLSYDNVRLFDYSSRLSWIQNLDEYFDFSHHSTKISNEIMKAMSEDDGRIRTLSELKENEEVIIQAVKEFAEKYE